MKKKNTFVSNILKDLKETSKYLSESYIFKEDIMPYGEMEGGPDEYDEYGGGQPMEHGGVHGDPTVPQQQPQVAQQGDSEEEIAMHAQEVIKHEPIIGKIRETAIEGLKKYSDNPTSKLYEFFKKVFLESDKVLTDTGSKN